MRPRNSLLLILMGCCAVMLAGCADDTAGLKQKVAELEKKIEKQQKQMGELSSRFAPPKDFSADIQRIEDQQERISQILKTQVEPVNSKLEEFRSWAQEAQKENEDTRQKLKSLGQAVNEARKSSEAATRDLHRLMRDYLANKKKSKAVADQVEALTKGLTEMRKDLLENNTSLVAAVKKTLPKVRDAAVDQLKERLAPIEKTLSGLQSGVQSDRKAIESLSKSARHESGRDVRAVIGRLRELEEVLASQKGYLLELGSKVHEIEMQLRRTTGRSGVGGQSLSSR